MVSISMRRSCVLIRSRRLVVVVRSDLDGTLSQDRSRVDAFVDDEQRAAGDHEAVFQSVAGGVHAGTTWS